jgi:hypothetical protein
MTGDRRKYNSLPRDVVIAILIGAVGWFAVKVFAQGDDCIQVRQRLEDHEKNQNVWESRVNDSLDKMNNKIDIIDNKVSKIQGVMEKK